MLILSYGNYCEKYYAEFDAGFASAEWSFLYYCDTKQAG